MPAFSLPSLPLPFFSVSAGHLARAALFAAWGTFASLPQPAQAASLATGSLLDEEDAQPNQDSADEALSDDAAEHGRQKDLPPAGKDTGDTEPGKKADRTATSPDAQEGEDELTLDAWERDDWALARPRVALFDVAGYFRLRADAYRRLDFGNNSVWEYDSDGDVLRYSHAPGQSARYSQASMRLRVEPRLHISDALEVFSTVDLMDNLVFGSTPNTLPPRPRGLERPPANVLSTGQVPMRRGVNSLTDSIVVKRLWARVGFLNDQLELKVGRMPDHWGLGIWYNNGDCLNCDMGTVVDRASLTFRALGHTFQPQIDWVSRGPVRQTFGAWDLAPVDAANWDNAVAYGLRVAKNEHPDDIRDALRQGRHVVTYGLSNALRRQANDFPYAYWAQNNFDLTQGPDFTSFGPERRDAWIYQGDVYGKYFSQKLELGAEVALMAGSFYDSAKSVAAQAPTSDKTRVVQMGAAAEATLHLREDRRGTRLSLKVGGASGDTHRGVGARDMADSQRGQVQDRYDGTLKNFQFSPDYHIDLLLFRRILGTVTDAWYVRPEVAYRFDDKLSGRLALIYSQLFDRGSVPNEANNRNKSLPLGAEIDGEVAYGLYNLQERGQLMASLAAGLLFPLPAFNKRPSEGVLQQGHFAWTLQARMFLTF